MENLSNWYFFQTIYIKAILIWILFVPVAIVNGLIREKFYKRFTGDSRAHQISTVIASVAFISLSYFMLSTVISNADPRNLFIMGFLWVVMTMVFEFGFGHYI